MLQRIEIIKKDGSTITSGAMDKQRLELYKAYMFTKIGEFEYKIYEV